NAVYIGANGELRTKNGDLSKGVLLTNSDGVLVDAKGELVTAGGKLTKIEGTDFYKTKDGMIVTKDGHVVSLSGDRLFISDDGLLQNAYLRPIRFKGKSLSIGKNGHLYDEQGKKVVDGNQSPILLTENGLSSEDGVLLNHNQRANNEPTIPPANEVVELITSSNKEDSVTEEYIETEPLEEDEDTSELLVNRTENGLPKIDLSELSSSEITALNERYLAIKASLSNKLAGHTPKFDVAIQASESVSTGQAYVDSIRDNASVNQGGENNSSSAELSESGNANSKQKAGTLLYAVNTTKVNTDVNSKVVFNLFGVPRDHFLYGATAHGKVSLKYDFIVVEFNRICMRLAPECMTIDAIAVDPGTREPSINGEIDKHYWYRFGGLTIASLIQGAAEAVGSSQERTEETDITGKKVTYSGLDGTKLAISSTQVLGEQFANIFLENASRPITGYIEEGEEVGIFLFEDINFKAVK
ncbi:MAG: DotG/IcmE/VirB10 family protein, partial [Bacteroidia bacterium]